MLWRKRSVLPQKAYFLFKVLKGNLDDPQAAISPDGCHALQRAIGQRSVDAARLAYTTTPEVLESHYTSPPAFMSTTTSSLCKERPAAEELTI
jgi:hypothetical protein